MTQLGKELQKANKEKALLTIEVRQLKKKIEKLEKRSKDYLDIYRKLLEHQL